MDGFPFVHRERACRSDCDPRGHVDNAALLGDLGGESVPFPDELKERLRP